MLLLLKKQEHCWDYDTDPSPELLLEGICANGGK